AGNGTLTLQETQRQGVNGVDGLSGATNLTVSGDAANVYVTANHTLATFERDATTGGLTFAGFQTDGVNGVQGLFPASSVRVSPDGKTAYVGNHLGSALGKGVAIFERDASMQGSLTFLGLGRALVSRLGLRSASWVAVSPDAMNVYALGNGDD